MNILLSIFVSFVLILTPFYLLILDVESYRSVGRVAQLVATDYGLDGSGSNPSGDEIFRPSRPVLGPTQPPEIGTGSFPGVKCGRGVLLTTHPLLVPRSWKSRAIPLIPPSGPHRACNGITYIYINKKITYIYIRSAVEKM